jgi:hypothetical protein
MGVVPIIGGDKIITAVLLASTTLGKVNRSNVPDLRVTTQKSPRDCRTCTAIHCPMKDTPAYKYLHDDPILEEICSHYWR